MSYQKGSKGKNVSNIQHYCNIYGFTSDDGKKLKEDGIFGDKTKQAVIKFQKKVSIKQDGIWGSITEAHAQQYIKDVAAAKKAAAAKAAASANTAASKVGTSKSSATAATTSTASAYTRIPLFNFHHQLTDYTCFDASLFMILSTYNLVVSEQQLAQWAGSKPVTGTTPANGIICVNKVNAAYKKSFKLSWISFKNTPLATIAALIKQGKRFFLHIRTGEGSKTTDKNYWRFPGYTGIWGHYVMLVGVNTAKNTVTIADPDRDIKEVSYSNILHATGLITGVGSLGEFYEA